MGTKIPAGSANNLKMSGVPHLYMIGQSMMCGMPIIYLIYDYNHLYDLYYMAGLKPSQMRVASPFNDYAKDALNLYRVIDPEIWSKLVGRVQGANFAAIYGKTKAMGYRNIFLPEGIRGNLHNISFGYITKKTAK